eukprot:2943531-Amphidinium_carterae.1
MAFQIRLEKLECSDLIQGQGVLLFGRRSIHHDPPRNSPTSSKERRFKFQSPKHEVDGLSDSGTSA